MSLGHKLTVALFVILALWSVGLWAYTNALLEQYNAIHSKYNEMERNLATQQDTIELQMALLNDAEQFAAGALAAAKVQGENYAATRAELDSLKAANRAWIYSDSSLENTMEPLPFAE